MNLVPNWTGIKVPAVPPKISPGNKEVGMVRKSVPPKLLPIEGKAADAISLLVWIWISISSKAFFTWTLIFWSLSNTENLYECRIQSCLQKAHLN